jgi:hypothetical protein
MAADGFAACSVRRETRGGYIELHRFRSCRPRTTGSVGVAAGADLLGTQAFVEGLKEKLADRTEMTEIPRAQRRP